MIGGGIAGLTVASNVAFAGKKVAIVEARDWGGTSINRGATAKKAILALSELHSQLENFQGRGFSELPDIQWEDMITHRDWLVEDQRVRAKERVLQAGAVTFEGHARFEDHHHVWIGGKLVSADQIVVASGSKPRELDFEGSHFVDDSGNLMRQQRKPQNIAIIGAGIIALSLISSYAQAGVKVHVIQHNDVVLRGFDEELVRKLVTCLKNKGVTFHFDVEPQRVEKTEMGYRLVLTNGESLDVTGVYDAAGRVPNIDSLGLEKAGVTYGPKGIQVNAYLQTSQAHIWAIGDCCDAPVPKLSSYADYQAKYVARALLEEESDELLYPEAEATTVFSIPKLGKVGLSTSQAYQNLQHYQVKSLDISYWQNYRRTRDDLAQIKLVVERSSQKVLGAEILSNSADILTNYLAILINLDVTMQDVQNIIFAYPSIATDLYGLWT